MAEDELQEPEEASVEGCGSVAGMLEELLTAPSPSSAAQKQGLQLWRPHRTKVAAVGKCCWMPRSMLGERSEAWLGWAIDRTCRRDNSCFRVGVCFADFDHTDVDPVSGMSTLDHQLMPLAPVVSGEFRPVVVSDARIWP